MTSIHALLEDLDRRDIKLWVEDGRLRFSAPQGAMDSATRQALKARKDELLAALAPLAPVELPTVAADPGHANDPFPLTRIQQAYWVGRGAGFELSGRSAHVYAEIEGPALDTARLEWAWNTLVRRHGMLRAVVDADGMQRVLPEVPEYCIAQFDLSAADAAAIDAHLAAQRDELSHHVAPADCWPLFALRVTLLPGGMQRLHVSFDGLVFDASSILLLAREAWTLLQAGDAGALPPLALEFRDYVLAEAALRDGDDYRRDRAWWLARLDALPPAPDLPRAATPPASPPVFRRRGHTLPADRFARLKEQARGHGLTPSTVLLAAFVEVLGLWARRPDFTVNVSLFNRLPLHPQVNDIVGDFTTLTLVPVDCGSGATFAERARAVHARLWEGIDHRAMSGVEVVAEWARRHNVTGRAAMPVVFTSALALDGVDGGGDINPFGRLAWGITQTPQVSLDMLAIESRGSLAYAWDAVEDLFPAGMLDEMFDAYAQLLERLCDDLAGLGRFTLPSPAGTPPVAPVPDGLLHQPFFRLADEKPDAVAVISSRRTLSYGELAAEARAVAAALASRQVVPGQLVAVVMEKGWEQAAAVLGTLAAGAAYLPIEADWPKARRDAILARTDCRLALVQPHLAATLDLPAGVEALAVGSLPPAAALPPCPAQPHDLAYVIFTSGSTGTPKGVMIDHRGALNTIADVNARWAVGAGDRVLALSALSFDLSVWDIFGLLAAGGAVVLPDAGMNRNPAHWRQMMAAHGVTLWNSVPALMRMLTEYLSAEPAPCGAPVRVALLSGDWIPLDLPAAIRAAFPACAVVSLGGATEASIWSIFHPVEELAPDWSSVPYGRPLTNQDVVVLDAQGEVRPTWAVGEIAIGGIGIAQGYWRDGPRTDASFIRHPRSGARLYRTGDLGRYRPGGVIEFLGREDQLVKIGGFRIELGDIEAALKRHPAVAEVLVDAQGSREDRALVAYVVPAAPAAPDWEDVSAGMRFKMSRPGVRKDLDGQPQVALPGAAVTPARLAAFLRRQSFRQFAPGPVGLDALAGMLLDAACAIRIGAAPLPKLRYGSAGGLYPVQVYLHVHAGRMDGLDAGLYYLDPDRQTLVRLGDYQPPAEALGGWNRPIVEAAAFSLFLVAEMAAIVPQYPQPARDFCLLEAGYLSQALHEAAPDHGLGLCAIGSVADAGLAAALDLGEGRELLHCLVGGAIAAEQMQRWGAFAADGGLDVADLLAHAGRVLPDYMVPRRVIVVDRLPLSANGKVDRAALPAPVAAAAPAPAPAPAPSGSDDPEAVVAAAVEAVLGRDGLDRQRNFFDLGADSVKIIQIRNRLLTATGRDVDILDFFRHPTIAALAGVLSKAPKR